MARIPRGCLTCTLLVPSIENSNMTLLGSLRLVHSLLHTVFLDHLCNLWLGLCNRLRRGFRHGLLSLLHRFNLRGLRRGRRNLRSDIGSNDGGVSCRGSRRVLGLGCLLNFAFSLCDILFDLVTGGSTRVCQLLSASAFSLEPQRISAACAQLTKSP